jgi:hypothetical protein
VTLGPVALTHGRATLRVASREPARRYGQDDRLLSVRFDSAFAVARRP